MLAHTIVIVANIDVYSEGRSSEFGGADFHNADIMLGHKQKSALELIAKCIEDGGPRRRIMYL